MFGALASIAAPIIGGFINNQNQKDAGNQNYAAQKEFAQMGLQWKVADAKAAGLHPMAALGASGASFSPSFQAGSNDYSGVGDGINQLIAGQNTKRAETATKTETEKQLEQLALERAQLQNRLLEGQVQNEWASLLGAPPQPSFPVASSTPVSGGPRSAPPGLVKAVPSQSISHTPGDKGLEAADTPGYKRFGVTPGLSVELPGNEMSQSLESMGIAGHVLGPVLSAIRGGNQLINGGAPPKTALPDGYKWSFNPFSRTWTAAKIDTSKVIRRRDKPPMPYSRGGATGSW